MVFKEVFEEIKELLAEQFDIDHDKIKLETSFIDNLNADSLDIADLLTSVSDKFDIDIESESIENFKTVEDLLKFVEKSKK
ncbi:MAG: acyl carrier protein [Oscillospiraceae bacterium]|jgi:acyl carrier protein|nr:acyl carrier protein [Oscillospiraceae bacterium]